jgi:hypothetical protein
VGRAKTVGRPRVVAVENHLCFARTGWNCNKVGVNLLVIPSAAVITPHGNG